MNAVVKFVADYEFDEPEARVDHADRDWPSMPPRRPSGYQVRSSRNSVTTDISSDSRTGRGPRKSSGSKDQNAALMPVLMSAAQ